jgi:hypothetical protein
MTKAVEEVGVAATTEPRTGKGVVKVGGRLAGGRAKGAE